MVTQCGGDTCQGQILFVPGHCTVYDIVMLIRHIAEIRVPCAMSHYDRSHGLE